MTAIVHQKYESLSAFLTKLQDDDRREYLRQNIERLKKCISDTESNPRNRTSWIPLSDIQNFRDELAACEFACVKYM